MHSIIDRVNLEFRDRLEHAEVAGRTVGDCLAQLNAEFVARGCTLLGGKPFPIYLKPVFIDEDQERIVARATETILSAIERLTDLYFTDPGSRPDFRLKETEAELAEIDPGLQKKVWITRNDAFLDGDSFKFIEFNADSPGGPMYTDIQTELLESTPIMRDLGKKYALTSYRFVPQVRDTLLAAYREFCQARGRPAEKHPFVALVAGDQSSTLPEFLLIVEWLRGQGFGSAFSDPRWLEWDGENLRTGDGEVIDVIYRRGWLPDWTDHMDEVKPLIDAYRAGAVCVVNPPRSILAANKHVLGMLQEERFEKLFNVSERRAIRDHLPWTRFVQAARTIGPKGKKVDLLPYIHVHREELVLKPMDMLGGKDVCVGLDAGNSEWDEWIGRALVSPFVVQEYVPIPEEEFPVATPDLAWVRRKVNHNFYGFTHRYAGGLVRASASSVINISKDGGLTSIMVVRGEL